MVSWLTGGLLVAGLGVVAALLLRFGVPGRVEDAPEADPLFVVGMLTAGVGAALTGAVGPAMIGLLALGVVVMAVGAARMWRSGGGRPAR